MNCNVLFYLTFQNILVFIKTRHEERKKMEIQITQQRKKIYNKFTKKSKKYPLIT